jgi:FAD/FMN-containing dehydrogenase
MPEPTELIRHLQTSITGTVITPTDPSYDRARSIFVGGIDARPSAIARVADHTDVAIVVTATREAGVDLAVRSGGHSAAGHGTSNGGIVLDLRAMNDVQIDADERIAWAQTGATAGRYTTAAADHGLATGFGDMGTVGLGGITLAGGSGFLSRKHGLTIDQLVAAEVVTADGELLRADADTNVDLFWALRGGGGNFGVVTRFAYHLKPVTEFVGGMLILPATAEVITGFVAAAQAAPEELTTIMMAMIAPPMPFLPPEVHGQLVVLGMFGYIGPAEDGERAIAPFRQLATPLADMVKPQPYANLLGPPPADDAEEFHPTAAVHSMFIDDFDHAAAEMIIDQIRASTAMIAAVQLRVLGGAIDRVPSDATAYAHRGRGILVNVNAMYQTPEQAAEQEAWVAKVAHELSDGRPGVYAGFLADEGPDRVREAYPSPTWDRLVEIKRRYDPANLFRSNHNVLP